MRFRRRLSSVLIVAGVALLAYAAVTLFWRDPITDLYERWQQRSLSSELERAFADYRDGPRSAALAAATSVAERRKAVAEAARAFERRIALGRPLGRLVVPKLELDRVFVHGTRWGADLSRGPGHYEETSLPGLGRTTGIAGHRTTFGAPFREIDELERGDEIVLELPYGRFRYRVVSHEIVKSNDWSVIRPRGYDAVMLSACHPLYSAAKRWIVYARLVEVEPAGGTPYELAARTAAASG